MSVIEGDSVTLHTDVIMIPKRWLMCQIQWKFGPEDALIVSVIWHCEGIFYIRCYYEEIFRNRLQMDNQTGSLTTRNIRTTDSGLYQILSQESYSMSPSRVSSSI